MKVFLSHAASDSALATYLTESLGDKLGLTFFGMRDFPPGRPWIDQIKLGVAQSDVLWSIITPESAARPWISAECACFWYESKLTVPLLAGVGFDTLWDPMKAYTWVKLDDGSSVTRFLRAVADRTGTEPPEGVVPLANELAKEVARIQKRQALADLEEVFKRIARNLQSGTDNISPDDVRALVQGNRLDELMHLTKGENAAPVKQRQVAMSLLEVGRTGEAVAVARGIPNRAEVRTIAIQIVRRMPRGATLASEEWQALDRLYDRLRFPQRRDVLEAMDASGVAPLGRWTEGPGADV
jgi:acyl carrier protein phosphodiesterase